MANSQNLFDQAFQLHQSGRVKEAINLYEKLLPRQKNNFQLLYLLGSANLQNGQHEQAIVHLQRSLALNPKNPSAHNNTGIAFKNLKRLEQALASYDKAITLKPDYADAHYNRGVVLQDLNRQEEALASYNKAIALKPDYADAFNNRGNVLKFLKRLDEALASYDRAIVLKPDYADAYCNRGNALKFLKRLDEALASYDKAIALKPEYSDAHYCRAVVLQDLKRLDEALASYDQAIALKPDMFKAHYNRGYVLEDLKRPDEALVSYDQSIILKPDYADAFNNRGNVLRVLKRPDEALASYDRAIALKPDYADAFHNRGNALQDLKRPDEALASYDQAIALKPDYADAFNIRGDDPRHLKCLEEALASYDQAIALKPDYADAHYNRGVALQNLKHLEEALASYDRAIALKPDYADAFNNRGNVLRDLNRMDEALASYDKAIVLKPDMVEAFHNRGNAFQDIKRMDEALASYDGAIALKIDIADAFNGRGNALRDLKRLDEALASYDKAIALKPDMIEAYGNRGNALRDLKRLDEALASYDSAIAIKPDIAVSHHNRGITLADLKRLEEALSSYDKALALKPDYEFLFGLKLYTQTRLCDWGEISNQLPQLESDLIERRKVTNPFPVLGLTDKPELQLLASKIYADTKYPPCQFLGDFNLRKPDGKIRIGYYSADFHNHATAYLMAELFEAHDSQMFELHGFSFGPDANDEMRQRVSNGLDYFYDVTNQSDREVAKMSRDLGIDIAVDLKGFTLHSRTGIFAERCAPIQVNYLGYPGTMAAPYIDYIVADKTLIPEDSQVYYTEKVVYLPHSYQVNDSKRKISDRIITRQEVGLPENGFVFCCFNNNYKILPTTFDGWMRILKQVSDSVLWLLDDNPTASNNLRREAKARGVEPSRLVFAKRMELDDHLARHRLADLFIDTLPCNAHTTTSDALWAGLPVLTLIGKSFAGRVAASLLNAMDLPELITDVQDQYEARAIELAINPPMLARIKEKIERNRLCSPLFNGQLFARHIEAAYMTMYQRYQSGQEPDHIHIDSTASPTSGWTQ